MPVNVNIVISTKKNVNEVSSAIARIIQKYTGFSVNIFKHDNAEKLQSRRNELQSVERKLLK